jgi:hypothetical protein
MTKRPWTAPELSRAKQMELLGFNFREIGLRLGRSRSSVVYALRPRAKTAECVDCGTAVFVGSKTGRCRACKNVFIHTIPGVREAKAEGVRRKWREDPCFAAKMRMIFREVGRANGTDPIRRARLVEHGHRMKAQLHSPESFAKRDYKIVAAKLSERAMGWCPVEYRDEYKRLTQSKRMLAHEAREIILDQVRSDLAKLSPFERQERALTKGAAIVANDQKPSLANPGLYGERKAG